MSNQEETRNRSAVRMKRYFDRFRLRSLLPIRNPGRQPEGARAEADRIVRGQGDPGIFAHHVQQETMSIPGFECFQGAEFGIHEPQPDNPSRAWIARLGPMPIARAEGDSTSHTRPGARGNHAVSGSMGILFPRHLAGWGTTIPSPVGWPRICRVSRSGHSRPGGARRSGDGRCRVDPLFKAGKADATWMGRSDSPGKSFQGLTEAVDTRAFSIPRSRVALDRQYPAQERGTPSSLLDKARCSSLCNRRSHTQPAQPDRVRHRRSVDRQAQPEPPACGYPATP